MSKMDNSKHRLLMLMLDNSQLGTTVSWGQQSDGENSQLGTTVSRRQQSIGDNSQLGTTVN